MTRLILKAIDVGGSAVFVALCTKAFFVQFYKDIVRHLRRPMRDHGPARRASPKL